MRGSIRLAQKPPEYARAIDKQESRPMDLELEDKVAIVTGGSQGIGKAASYVTGTSINLDRGTSAVL
jgi:hypothetical protein